MLYLCRCEKGRLLSGLRGSSGGTTRSSVAEGEEQQRVAEARRCEGVVRWPGTAAVALSHSSGIGWQLEGGCGAISRGEASLEKDVAVDP